MQLMTFNSLLMFDIVFVFFLFLVGVTCLVYYLPPATRKSKSSSYTAYHQSAFDQASDIECGAHQRNNADISGCISEEDEQSVQYYRQFVNRHHRCPHHHHHYHYQQQQLQKQQQQHAMNNRYMPVMTSSPEGGGPSSANNNNTGALSRSYIPPPSPPSMSGDVAEDGEEQGNMEILPPQEPAQLVIKSHKSSRHLYHNILNSAIENDDDPYGDEDDECNMIATNVEILSSPVASVSTSLPASPGHNTNNNKSSGSTRPRENPGETVINIQHNHALDSNSRTGSRYHLPVQHRPECHSARHVVGICQYHMQQHLKSHHQQHQLHRLYQQQQLLQQFANQEQQPPPTPSSTSSSNSSTSASSGTFATKHEMNLEQSPQEVGDVSLEQKKVQYIVVDQTTDRNKKRLNKYCHVKAQNCDINKKCAAGPVDEV